MKRIYKVLATVFSVGTLTWAMPVHANPGISITQRDGKVGVDVCMSGAKKALQKLKFENIKSSSAHAEGNFNGYSALVTCYKVASSEDVVVQAIIIAGPSSSGAKNLSKQFIEAMR